MPPIRKETLWNASQLRPYLGRVKDMSEIHAVMNLSTGLSLGKHVFCGTGMHAHNDHKDTGSLGHYITKSRKIAIQSAASGGKTLALLALCSRIASGMAQQLPDQLENKLPIFIDCKSVDRNLLHQCATLEDYVVRMAEDLHADTVEGYEDKLRAWVKTGNVALLVDDFDSLSNEEQGTVISWATTCEQTTAIITVTCWSCLESSEVFHRLELSELSAGVRAEAARHWINSSHSVGSEEKATKFLKLVNENSDISELSKSPFWLNLMLNVYSRDGLIPNGRYDLMRSFIHAALGRSHKLDGSVIAIGYPALIQWLGEAAWKLVYGAGQGSVPSYTREELKARLIKLMSLSNQTHKDEADIVEAAFRWVTKGTCLVKELGNGRFCFNGQPMAQYLASHYLSQQVATPSFVLNKPSCKIPPTMLSELSANANLSPVLEMMLEHLAKRYSKEWPPEIVRMAFETGTSDFCIRAKSQWLGT
ncbi:hypothetical protein RYA05_01120 [Pseudomonas syringae pv. actinidiae]|nr:hypothetical protein [Pseudomonas syringae pv. actinidiae]